MRPIFSPSYRPAPDTDTNDTEAQREHRFVVMLEDVQRQVAALPHPYFAYERMSPAARAEKERTLRHMICGSIRVLTDTTQAVTAAGIVPAFGPTVALAYYLQARVHHALACDANAREAAPREHVYHQRLENLNHAEESYRHAIDATDVPAYRARAYFDLGILLAESDRHSEALTAFEAVTDLDVTGSLCQAAEQNLKRLRSAPATGAGTRRRPRFSLPRVLGRAAILGAAGTLIWAAWAQSFAPPEQREALWHLVGAPYRALYLPRHKATAPQAMGKVVVSAGRLHVRSGRGTQYPIVETAQRGQELTVIGQVDAWWKIRFPGGATGWASRRFTGPLSKD